MMDAFVLPNTLAQALQRRAQQTPDRLALRFLAEDQEQGAVLSYRDLDLRARTIAPLRKWGIGRSCCFPAARTMSRRSLAACTPG